MEIPLISKISVENRWIVVHFWFVLSFLIQNVTSESLAVCKTEDSKYDFTECDAYGGKWRVVVPNLPGRCTGGLSYVPTRVDNCYTSCEGGQFFNKSTLLCEDCQPGHYSLSGGIVFDNFSTSHGDLPEGFHILTDPRDSTTDWTKCPEWRVDSNTGSLVSMIEMKQDNSQKGCVSAITYTVKVIKRGRFRFTYRYKTPKNMPLSLLFNFNYRLYGGIGIIEDDLNPNVKFPSTTIEKNFETIDLQLNTPGLYVFTWKSIVIRNFHTYFDFSNPSMNFDNYGKSLLDVDSENIQGREENLFQNKHSKKGLIRIEKIIIEGVAYASECTPCEPGTYAPKPGMKECLLCPKNTAYNESGAINCSQCDPITEYAPSGASYCSKRPICGVNDLYSVPVGDCDPNTFKQTVQNKWIEPRICVDLDKIFPNHNDTINCTTSDNITWDCDPGMERNPDNVNDQQKYCQFCPEGFYRDENIENCKPCPPVTNPYHMLSIQRWNDSLPGWSNPVPLSSSLLLQENDEEEDAFADNPLLLNYYLSRQCFLSDEDLLSSIDDGIITEARRECLSGIAWQPFQDYIRTGASASLNAYLVLSLTIPYFRSMDDAEISFTFETYCSKGDQCLFLFIETKPDESDLRLQDLFDKDFTSQRQTTGSSRKKFSFSQQTINKIIKDWSQSTDGKIAFRFKIERNITMAFSWIFKRSTSFQSYAKIYSLLLTGSSVGSAIKCQPCPVLSESSMQCVSCPPGQYLQFSAEANQSESVSGSNVRCENCPKNHVLNASTALSLGIKSCIPCGENLVSDNLTNICYSDCSVTFNQNDHYDLRELHQPILYKGINLFTSTGTQYTNLFKISLCGHPKREELSTCLNNITVFADDSSGVRSYICRSTIIPDETKVFAAQSASLGDELVQITHKVQFENITVHPDFTDSPEANKFDRDYHLFYKTSTPTNACPLGRKLTITMRCVTGSDDAKVETPHSCPDGTCNGCDFHLIIKTSTAAACRLCRPYSQDYEMVIGECIDGIQQVHYLNPKGCVLRTGTGNSSDDGKQYVLKRTCSLLLPKQVQIGIALAMVLGLLLLLLVFHFWNKNRSLEYKYTKLIENTSEGKGNDELSLDNCCVEDEDLNSGDNPNNYQQQQLSFKTGNKSNTTNDDDDNNNDDNIGNIENRNNHSLKITTTNKKPNNRIGRKHDMRLVVESQEMKQLFPDAAKIRTIDDEGYETIHLISATANNNRNNNSKDSSNLNPTI